MASKRDALIGIMHHAYEDIREMEAEYGLWVDAGDLRPRIEYFHDAVRTLSHNPDLMYAKKSRLSVEWLAYDLSCLRYIQERPLAQINHQKPLRPAPAKTPGKSVAMPGRASAGGDGRTAKTMPPNIRTNLAARYAGYTVMFAALFAETVDMNYQTRVNERDQEVEDLAQIEQMLQMLEQGQIMETQVEEVIQHLENEELKTELMIKLHQVSQKKQAKFAEVIQMIKSQMKVNDAEIAQMNKAHMSYLSGQMMLYQESKDMVKKLAAQGMNIAGQYLESAMQQAQGRGQGRGF